MSNKVKPLTSEQQFALREKARNELERLEAVSTDDITSEKIRAFLEKYKSCEIVYKVILIDHQQNKTGKRPERMQVKMTQVPFALDYAGYDFDKALLSQIFGSEEKIGRRTAKKLRDSLTHSMNQNAIDELIDREEELHGYMDQFLEKIRVFDSAD